MNPSSMAKQQRAEELEKLRKENETLRRKLQILEEGGGGSQEEVSPGLNELTPEGAPSVMKQVEGRPVLIVLDLLMIVSLRIAPLSLICM